MSVRVTDIVVSGPMTLNAAAAVDRPEAGITQAQWDLIFSGCSDAERQQRAMLFARLAQLRVSDLMYGVAQAMLLKGDLVQAETNATACLAIRETAGRKQAIIESLNQLAVITEQNQKPGRAAEYRERVLAYHKNQKDRNVDVSFSFDMVECFLILSSPLQKIKREIVSILRLRLADLSLDMQHTVSRTRKDWGANINEHTYRAVIRSVFARSPSDVLAELLDRVSLEKDRESSERLAALISLTTEEEVGCFLFVVFHTSTSSNHVFA